MQFLIFIVAMFLSLFALEKLLRKVFRAEKAEFLDPHAKKIKQRGEGTIFVLALCFLPFVFASENPVWLISFFLGHQVVSNGFEAYVEWKYANDAREHLVTLSLIPVSIATMLGFAYVILHF